MPRPPEIVGAGYPPSETARIWWLGVGEKYHREDGPAVEWDDGLRHWYLNNKHVGYNVEFGWYNA